MTINAISASATAYQVQTLANAVGTQIESSNTETGTSVATTDNGQLNETFVKNVMQSLQNLGLGVKPNGEIVANDTLSADENAALTTFLQNLYKALSSNGNPPTAPVANGDNTTDVNSTSMSGGTNFKYAVDLSEADLGDYLPNVKANLKTALENIGQYISSDVVFNLKVLTKYTSDENLAQTQNVIDSMMNAGEKGSVDTSFVSNSIHGVELTPNQPDSTLAINLAKIGDMSFSGLPEPDKFDLTSILTHEILHGLAFTGTIGVDSTVKTGFDELVVTEGDTPYFVGRHAKTANGGENIPLSPATSGSGSAYYHVAIPSDLMSAELQKGEVKTISALDIAMLQDIGVSVTGASPTSLKSPNAYDNPTTKLQNLIGSIKQDEALKTDFNTLVQSLGGSDFVANLPDFLTQLASNTENTNPLRNGTGSLLSVSA